MTNGEILYELQKLTSKQLSQSKLAHELKRQGYSRITKYIPEKKYSRYGYILYTSLDNASSIFKEYVVEVEEKVF